MLFMIQFTKWQETKLVTEKALKVFTTAISSNLYYSKEKRSFRRRFFLMKLFAIEK